MPYFSIILPVYNVAPYLVECIESLKSQSFTDWECICVDDGSTDEGGQILDCYAREDTRFTVFHQKNSGVSAARNKALENCSGEWICFLDGDDKVQVTWLDEIKIVISAYNMVNMVRIAYSRWFEGNKIVPMAINGNEIQYFEGEKAKEMAFHCISKVGAIWSSVIKKEIIRDVNFDPAVRMREDALFLMEIANSVTGFAITPIKSYLYRIRGGSAYRSPQKLSDAILFQEKLNGVWVKYHFSPKDFTNLTVKNLHFCIQTCKKEKIKFIKLRKLINEAANMGAFKFSLLGIRNRIKWFIFLKMGIWRALYGSKFYCN